ncbi:MAG: hypothetical protein M0C28_41485 [Candidatus Moduliflexus flocculans]|nr:hypothetical protein [Candidatus Moduliflexus flocculans]
MVTGIDIALDELKTRYSKITVRKDWLRKVRYPRPASSIAHVGPQAGGEGLGRRRRARKMSRSTRA